MNTTKSVYNRLFAEDKVELASERVELGLKEDALETVKLFEKSYSTVDNEIFKFYNQLEAAKKQFEGIKGDISNFLSFEGKIKSEQNKILAEILSNGIL